MSNRKMFKCTVAGCEKVFTANRNMLRHAKTHDGAKFQCNICAKLFTYKHDCVHHVKTIHRTGRVVPDKEVAGSSITPPYGQAGSSNTEDDTRVDGDDTFSDKAYDKAPDSFGKIFSRLTQPSDSTWVFIVQLIIFRHSTDIYITLIIIFFFPHGS